jgi:diaminopimelate decarboxylase
MPHYAGERPFDIEDFGTKLSPIVDGSRQDPAVTIAGRQCTSLDTLAHDVRLPEPEAGDLVIFF